MMEVANKYSAVRPLSLVTNCDKLRERSNGFRQERCLRKLVGDVELWANTIGQSVVKTLSENWTEVLKHPDSSQFKQAVDRSLCPPSHLPHFAVRLYSADGAHKPAHNIFAVAALTDLGYWPEDDTPLLHFVVCCKVYARFKYLQVICQKAVLVAAGVGLHEHVMGFLERPGTHIGVRGTIYELTLERMSRARLVSVCMGVVRPFSTQLLQPAELDNDRTDTYYITKAAALAIRCAMQPGMRRSHEAGCLFAASAVMNSSLDDAMAAQELLPELAAEHL